VPEWTFTYEMVPYFFSTHLAEPNDNTLVVEMMVKSSTSSR